MSTTEHRAYTEEQSKAIFEELLAGLEDLKQRGLLEHVRPKVMELLEAIEGQEHHLADADKKTDPDHIVGAPPNWPNQGSERGDLPRHSLADFFVKTGKAGPR